MSDCLCLRTRKKAKHFLKCLLYQEELYIIVEAFNAVMTSLFQYYLELYLVTVILRKFLYILMSSVFKVSILNQSIFILKNKRIHRDTLLKYLQVMFLHPTQHFPRCNCNEQYIANN